MIQGTASSVGKSILTAAFCRIFKQDGYDVAPFKSQNMALNSFITEEGLEMGRAQVVQAEAAKVVPNVLMNPILLKPSTDQKAQVIFMGKVHKNMSAREYHEFKPTLKHMIKEAYDQLSNQYDIVVLEGAGSPAEINLRENDVVNMGMAEISDSPVLLVGDIDRGGVFASIYGTIMLMTEEEKKRIKGVIINKFRGDVTILQPGLDMIEELTGVPVLGVVPYSHFRIEDEDSLSERFKFDQEKQGQLKVEILYLPHVSNFTDFNVFETQEDVHVKYVMRGEAISDPDVLIIPGSKNTIEDLIYLKNTGLAEQIIRLARSGKRIVGICGGYQILGNTLADPDHTESAITEIQGLGLLDTHTIFEKEKTTTQIKGRILSEKVPTLKDKIIQGYEIHMGQTVLGEKAEPFLTIEQRLDQTVKVLDGAISENGKIFGTYIHGIFDDLDFTRSFLNQIRNEKGLEDVTSTVESFEAFKEKEYDRLADVVRKHVDMDKVYEIMRNW
ncbi:MAG: cobyric acid synthase [Clostridia bacterium]|nr:cobyric acid synthase [Clostridia bacterium]